MAFHFEARHAYLEFCDYIASRNLQMIGADDSHDTDPAKRLEAKRQPSKARQSILHPQIEKALVAFQAACDRRMAGANEANAPERPSSTIRERSAH
jgi:hypothetical protein